MRTSRLVNARPRAGTCTSAELPALTAALDAEFVTGRGRSGSLATRYADVLTEANLPHVFVRRQAGRIVSCCAARRFVWTSQGQRWQGAMIGFVHTVPAARGRGLAAAVLEDAVDALAAAGADFAVLWSGLHGYYERLGWIAHDRGIFGSVSLDDDSCALPGPGEMDVARYEALRAPQARARVARDAARYRCVPLPATRVSTLFVCDGDAEAAALVGNAQGARYVYEVVGEAGALPALWQTLRQAGGLIHVNECIGSEFHRWLAAHVPIEFAAQELAYWRMLSPRARRAAWRDWHIPYFDRI